MTLGLEVSSGRDVTTWSISVAVDGVVRVGADEGMKTTDEELPKAYNWLQVNKLSLNTDKTVNQIYIA